MKIVTANEAHNNQYYSIKIKDNEVYLWNRDATKEKYNEKSV